jgi:hypothetical protein
MSRFGAAIRSRASAIVPTATVSWPASASTVSNSNAQSASSSTMSTTSMVAPYHPGNSASGVRRRCSSITNPAPHEDDEEDGGSDEDLILGRK